MLIKKPYSWENQFYERLCHECCLRFLPEADNSYKSGILKLRMSDPPKGIGEFGSIPGQEETMVWTAEPEEICISVGFPPKCAHCGLYMLNYNVLCGKDLATETSDENICGCRICKPHIYAGRIDYFVDYVYPFL